MKSHWIQLLFWLAVGIVVVVLIKNLYLNTFFFR
jgi:hypothetical protein